MLRGLKQFLRRIFGSNPAEPPKDPNARAPKKPKRPQQSGAVALAEPEED